MAANGGSTWLRAEASVAIPAPYVLYGVGFVSFVYVKFGVTPSWGGRLTGAFSPTMLKNKRANSHLHTH